MDNYNHFVRDGKIAYAGKHIIIDIWGVNHLNNLDFIEGVFRAAIAASGATLLEMKLHEFEGSDSGITGVAILAESHISIHTWPECSYAAIDVFMCGTADIDSAVEVMLRSFDPKHSQVSEHKRGVVYDVDNSV